MSTSPPDLKEIALLASWEAVLSKINPALLEESHRRSTGVFVRRCVFHREKTASLHFWNTSGRYHCHGCGADGDRIDFVFEWYFGHERYRKDPPREDEKSFLLDFFKYLPIMADKRQLELNFGESHIIASS